MITSVDLVTIYVRDEEEALQFYTEKLGFEKRHDFTVKPGTRWLTVAPPGSQGAQLVLHNPKGWHPPEQADKMLAQVGQTPPVVFGTADCRATCRELQARGVTILSEPKDQPHGVEATFADLYGNTFVLVELRGRG